MTHAVTRLTFTSIAVVALLSAACGKRTQTPVATPPPAPPVAAAPAPPPAAAPAPAPQRVAAAPAPPPARAAILTEDDLFARKTLAEINADRPLGHVLFDVDESTLRDDARAILAVNARWLSRWPSTRVSVEGHADERGTAEYNLALGERRANTVRSYLSTLGIAPERVLTVSMGKETPFCVESTEACWQENRRGQFVVTAK
jgi:peptidoglycan-associated lipoprotein